MSEAEDKKLFEDFKANKDLGKEPLGTPLNSDERKIVALVMGMQMAVLQFVKEGIIDPKEQVHFILHLNEYANMIYSGQEIIVDGQTMNLTSVLSKVFLESADIALNEGKKSFDRVRELAEQTNKQASDAPELDKPRTLH